MASNCSVSAGCSADKTRLIQSLSKHRAGAAAAPLPAAVMSCITACMPERDRPKPSQPQQIEGCCSHTGNGSSAIAAVTVGVLVELGIADPVPVFNAPSAHTSCSRASGVVRMLVRNRWVA